MKEPRLFAGPMSKEIVDSVIKYSNEKKKNIGLIPSRRQVENTGGYVNNWKTIDFSKYVRSKSGNVPLVRDHAGPGQGSIMDDGIESIESDISAGFNIIHIDPWKISENIEDGIQNTVRLINCCISKNPDVLFEIGTEESIFPYTPEDLNRILGEVEYRLGEDFKRVRYAVIQSGVKISGTENIGNFNIKRLEQMVRVVKDYGLTSKEHNGDYLSYSQIRERASSGLDCINIAPEFGVTQTRLLVNSGSLEFNRALEVCLKSEKYKKWIPKDLRNSPPAEMIVEVSGHYNFTKEPFKSEISGIEKRLSSLLFERFDEIHSAWEGC